jgi:DNA adenine methylase
MLRSPLRWVGSKKKLRDEVLRRFPEHVCYVEPFCGGAWVLLGKDPATSKSEVLNDMDGELINFWRVIKHRPAEFTESASWLLASRELIEEWRELPGVGGEIARAVKFYGVMRIAFGAKRTKNHFGSQRTARPSIFWPDEKEEVKAIMDRLRAAWVERLPWEKCLAKYDSPETFFYMDPPYRSGASSVYRHFFTDEDHARLADTVRGLKAKWLLSYNDDKFIRGLYRGRGMKVEEIRVRYGLQSGLGETKPELLIRNY